MDMMTAAHISAGVAVGVIVVIFGAGVGLYVWSRRQ
jgi:hypothetical protein